MNRNVMRFGQVRFDAARGAVWAAGRTARLDRSAAAILSLLLEEAGRDVHKDRLLEAGWPGRVVHENSLAKAIGRVRTALGSEREALETVHGFGYRLAAAPQSETMAEPRAVVRRRWVRGAAFGTAAAGMAGAAAMWLGAFPSGERPLIRGEPPDAVGRILWVDDHPENNVREKRFLERRKIAVYQVRTSEEALALLAMYDYRAVISDMNRNGRPLDGLRLVREMRRRNDDTPFILYTYVPSEAQRAHVAAAGGQGTAVTPDELYASLLPLFGQDRTRPAS